MKLNRRKFISTTAIGGLAATTLPFCSSEKSGTGAPADIESRYAKLNEILKQPVLKTEFFPDPVIIETVELLEYEGRYLCRIRSKDGAEGISVAHSDMSEFYPIFFRNVQPYLIGQDARELDLILEKIYLYHFNFRLNGQTMGLPLATAEFAILDMLGHIANKSMGDLVGEIHNPEVGVYEATEFRELPLEEHWARIKDAVAEYDVNALKIKVGYLFSGSTDIHDPGLPGKSEKLVPMVREHYGDDWYLYSDSNGYYDLEGAFKMGKLLQEYNYAYFEEPVLYWHFEEIKKLADELTIPIANGEQDQAYYNFKWLLANDGIDIVQPDNYYFGGMIKSTKVARMAEAFGKTIIPHMSGGGLGYLYQIQICSAFPNVGKHVEFKGLRTHVPFECPTSELQVVDGKIKVPTGPGLGITIDPEWIAKHKIVEG